MGIRILIYAIFDTFFTFKLGKLNFPRHVREFTILRTQVSTPARNN